MKKIVLAATAFVLIVTLAALGRAETDKSLTGEELFKEYCADCHPDGGNIINPSKTLNKMDREANLIMTKEDIVRQMRHPGKGMSTWSAATIPDDLAEKIADYIIQTFNYTCCL